MYKGANQLYKSRSPYSKGSRSRVKIILKRVHQEWWKPLRKCPKWSPCSMNLCVGQNRQHPLLSICHQGNVDNTTQSQHFETEVSHERGHTQIYSLQTHTRLKDTCTHIHTRTHTHHTHVHTNAHSGQGHAPDRRAWDLWHGVDKSNIHQAELRPPCCQCVIGLKQAGRICRLQEDPKKNPVASCFLALEAPQYPDLPTPWQTLSWAWGGRELE